MRHGESEYNLLGLCNDDPRRNVQLTERGRAQVVEASRQLAVEPIELIVVSELERTRQSAEIVNRYHHVPVLVHPGINDWRTGLDGQPARLLYRSIAADPMNTRLEGGETLCEHLARVRSFVHWLRGRTETTILVVAHEETLRAAAACCRGLDHDEMLALKFDNAEITIFEL
jgi:broad specificity phosphatase PhoE